MGICREQPRPSWSLLENEQGPVSVSLYHLGQEVFPNVPLEPSQLRWLQEMHRGKSCPPFCAPVRSAGHTHTAQPLQQMQVDIGLDIYSCTQCTSQGRSKNCAKYSQVGTGQGLGHHLLPEQASGWVTSIQSLAVWVKK